MTVSERAWQVWALLALAARNRQTLTYEMVGQLTGMAIPGVGAVLEPIQSYCLLNHLPALSALVVSKATGLPGTGFIAAADVPKEFIRIFEHDWLAGGCPSPAALAEAVRIQPSNGIQASAPTQVAAERQQPQSAPGARTSRYQPLNDHLMARQHMPVVQLTFAEIAKLTGPLPPSAYEHREWWANQSNTSNRAQAAAWQSAGFFVKSVEVSAGEAWVEFTRR
ncbi:MAG TPA: hypothetical protein VEY93_11615 [Longimicrobium sp.]|nr:hypothetical protein [Longimicrobium sp.]